MNYLRPLLRLLMITFSILIMAGMGVFFLRQLASQNVPVLTKLPQNPTLPLVFAKGDRDVALPFSREGYAAVMKLGNRVIPVVELRPTHNQEWIIQGVEPAALSETALKFKDFLNSFNPPQLMVIVHSREVAAAASLLAVLGPREEPHVTFIFSPNHRLNREFRKQRPRWFSGADASQWAQWHVFAAVGLEQLVPADFDWHFRGGPWGRAKPFAKRIQEELKRRRLGEILVAASPLETVNPDLYGVLTERPTEVLRILNAGSPSNR